MANKKRAWRKRRAERTAPAPTLPPHINKDRPPMGCILTPGTGWPMLSAPGKTYNELLAAIPGEWTAWTDYTLAGRTMTVYQSFPDGQKYSAYH